MERVSDASRIIANDNLASAYTGQTVVDTEGNYKASTERSSVSAATRFRRHLPHGDAVF